MLYTLTKLYFEGAFKPATRQKITSYFFPVSPVSECEEDLVVDSIEKSEDDEKDVDRDIGNKDLESIGFEDGGLESHEFEGKGSENAEIQDEATEDEGLGSEESRNTEFQMQEVVGEEAEYNEETGATEVLYCICRMPKVG